MTIHQQYTMEKEEYDTIFTIFTIFTIPNNVSTQLCTNYATTILRQIKALLLRGLYSKLMPSLSRILTANSKQYNKLSICHLNSQELRTLSLFLFSSSSSVHCFAFWLFLFRRTKSFVLLFSISF